MIKKLNKRKERSIPAAVAVGVTVSLLITLIGVTVAAQLIHSSAITENSIGIICPVVWFVSSFLGCNITMYFRENLISCAISAAVYWGILFFISAMILDSRFGTMGWGSLSVFLGALVAFLLHFRKSGGKKSKFNFRKQ